MSRLGVCATALAVIFAGGAAGAQTLPEAANAPTVLLPTHHDVTPALRDMPVVPPRAEHETPHPPHPVRGGPAAGPRREDPLLQTASPSLAAITPLVSFDGIGNTAGVLPPDTNGDVGPSHYVQWVNLSFAIYRKSDGAVQYGPADGSTIWAGFGGPCQTSNDGDPIVLYDEKADRWLMSQFALPSYPRGPYYQCIAVSTTNDPTGTWNRYSYSFNKLNDYPKFGVWSDGYYMTMNQYTCSILRCRWAGQGVVAFERAQMLTGGAARAVYFDMASNASLGGMLPADLDGTLPPPAGAPNYFMQVDDEPDQLQLWAFHADWGNTAASTFTRKALLPTSAFDSNMCAGSRNCIPQPGTSVRIDAIADRLMYRLQYRNFGDHESLVTNHTVDVNGADRGGVRWYEVRNPGSAPSIYQQGTFAPADTLHRWMGSAAMDSAGNLAIGYSASNSVTYPGIRFTGRLATDPPNTLTVAESDLKVGTGSQTHSSGRWGDYSMLAVDPSDGCTFWFTTEYYLGTAISAWKTNIGSFKLANCGGGSGGTAPAAPTGLSAAAVSQTRIDLAWTDAASDESGFQIERCQGASCTNFAQVATAGVNAQAFSDTTVSAGTAYSYQVRAFNAFGNSGYTNVASASTPPATTNAIHVSQMGSVTSAVGTTAWRASVGIEVRDASGVLVPNVTVAATWSNGYSGNGSCVTSASGTCGIVSGSISNATASVTLTVTKLTHATLPYDANANTVSAIVVNKP